ncbi:MAG: translocation/assembly module TamB domain-containing protein [Nitrospirae bacterium]|nr:translocation/assembly module TamB domain-containing protein [Nitrospirota bacterium]
MWNWQRSLPPNKAAAGGHYLEKAQEDKKGDYYFSPFNPVPTYVEIKNFSVSNKEPFKNEKVLHVERIRIYFRASAFLYRTFFIKSIQIKNPHIWLEEDVSDDNHSVLLQKTIELIRRPLIRKVIKRWDVENGILDIDSTKRSIAGRISGINIDDKIDIFLKDHKAAFAVNSIMLNINSTTFHSRELKGNVNILQMSEATINLWNLNINDKAVGALSLKGIYKDKKLLISSIKGNILNGTVSGNMDLFFTDDVFSYKGKLGMKGMDPDPVLSAVVKDLPNIKKEIDFNIQFSGANFERKGITADAEISGRFKSVNSEQKGINKAAALIKELNSSLELKNGILAVNKFIITSEKASLNLSGMIKEDGTIKLSAGLLSDDIKEFASAFSYPHASGQMSLSGEISGSLYNPSFDGEVSIKNGKVKDVSAISASGRVHYSSSALKAEDILIEKDESRYNINGSISLPEPYFNLKADIKDGSPKDIVSIFYKEIPIDMMASGSLTFKGTKKEFTGDGRLNVSSGSAYGQRFDSAVVTANLDASKIAFSKIFIKRDRSILNGTGFISFKNSRNDKTGWSAHLTASNIELKDIDLTKIKGDLPFDGGFRLDLNGEGDFKRPEIDGKIVFEKIRTGDRDLGDGVIEFGIKDMVFELDAALFNNSSFINGEIELRNDIPFKSELELIDVPLNSFIAILKPEPFLNMPLSATGKLEVKGSLKNIQTTTAFLNLDNLSADITGYKISNDGAIAVNYRGGEVIIDSFKIKGEDTSFDLSGRFRPFSEYNLSLSGEADMKISTLFTKELEYSRGKAYAAVMLSGDWLEPRVRGALTIRDGALRSRTLSQRVEKVNIGLFLNEKQILIEQFEGVIGGGTIKGTGRIELSGFRFGQFGMNFAISNARFTYPEGFSSTIDANLFIQGDEKNKFAKGDIFIKKGEYKRRVEWKSALLEFQKVKQPAKGEVPVFGDTALNIQIHGKENIWINNNTAKLPLEVDVILKGTINRPIIVGKVEAIDGEVYFRKNRFKVISGRVDFTDPEKINPVFDIHASSKVRKYQIDLNLTGTLDSFNLSLVSDPPLSETDILALLTTGKTTEELVGAEQVIGTAEAASFVTGQVQDIIEERVAEIMGFERFQVDPYYYSAKTSAGPRLTVSKHFWDDSLYVIYSTNLATTEEQLISIEYILSKNISLVGERDESGRLGADIKFRLEFK